jgi:hypothetical protein
MKRTLTLRLVGAYFAQIKAGTKTEEYRLRNDYWRLRIEGQAYDSLVITWGYPLAADIERRIELPWRGYEVKTITHPHFGAKAVEVYAIRLTADAAPAPSALPVVGRVYLVAVDDEMREQRCFSLRLEQGWGICTESAAHALHCASRTVRVISRVIREATYRELGLAPSLN